jgi:hypothetical protein
MSRLVEFLQDDTKALSATRLAFLTTLVSVLGVWLFSCWHAKAMVPIDTSAIYLVGTMMAGKVGQSFADNKMNTISANTPSV